MATWLEDAWLQRYLDRDLTEAESAWFEAYAMDKPRLLASIDGDTDLRDGMVAARLQAPSNLVLLQAPMRQATWLPFALAATLAVGAGIGWMLGGSPGRVDAVIPSPTRVVFDTYRGEATGPMVQPGAPAAAYVLVEVGLPTDARDVLLHVGGNVLPLVVSADGFSSFLLDRDDAHGDVQPRIEFRNEIGEPRVIELRIPSLEN